MNKKEVEKQLKDYHAALTVKETAEILRVSTKLVYRMVRDKTLPATKVGREKRIQEPSDRLSSSKGSAGFEPQMCPF